MSNTFSSSLVVDTATTKAITVLQNKLAPLRAFETDFSDDVVVPLSRIQVGVAASAQAAITNPSSFEAQATTLNNAPIVMTHICQPFGISSVQLNQGFKLKKIFDINLRSFANAIMDITLAPIGALLGSGSTSTYSAGYSSAISLATGGQIGNTFINGALGSLWSALKDGTEKHLVLDGSYMQYLLPQTGYSLDWSKNGAYGFDGIHLNNRWTGVLASPPSYVTGIVSSAGTDTSLNGSSHTIKGFVASPEALACASALPYIDPAVSQNMLVSEVINIPDLDLDIQFNVWGSLSSRALQASFDVVWGNGPADTTALKTIYL